MNKGYNTEEELVQKISNFYGFKPELIKNPQQCGLWHVRFEVNGIKYQGGIGFHGALPTLSVVGYITDKYYHETPVEDWFFDEFIKDKEVKIIHYIDPDSGDWEDTGIRFQNQEAAKDYLKNKNPKEYGYDICN